MRDAKNTISNIFEELLNKSIEANKTFINEGSKVFKQFSANNSANNNSNIFQNEHVTNTFNEYIKMNVNHFNNLMDLGLNFAKSFNTNPTNNTSTNNGVNEPSFILESVIEQGATLNFQFILDNVKTENASCELIHSDYILQSDTSVTKNFKTIFSPQSFQLKPSESASVKIVIDIPKNILPGLYFSKVQVKGFEPAYFSIQITVTESTKKPTEDVRKKANTKQK